MKPSTIQEWFNELPTGYRERAIANTDKDMLDSMAYSMTDAMSSAFLWVSTPEGYDFWHTMRKAWLNRGEMLPELPTI